MIRPQHGGRKQMAPASSTAAAAAARRLMRGKVGSEFET